ncbi:hypothetical protein OFN10_28730, partial [Escherichia coli]|nr:hypothetical protein [Escherichia coli]
DNPERTPCQPAKVDVRVGFNQSHLPLSNPSGLVWPLIRIALLTHWHSNCLLHASVNDLSGDGKWKLVQAA